MEPQHSQPSRFVQWSLIVGIIIVTNMFFNYAISLVYKAPQYPLSQPQIVGTIYTQDSCLSAGGQWTQTPTDMKSADPQGKNGGYCDPDYTKRMDYEASRVVYERTVFIILVILGAAILGLGIIIKQEVVAIALSWGGVLSLIIASTRYWSAANSAFKVAILAIALIALISLALKKFGK